MLTFLSWLVEWCDSVGCILECQVASSLCPPLLMMSWNVICEQIYSAEAAIIRWEIGLELNLTHFPKFSEIEVKITGDVCSLHWYSVSAPPDLGEAGRGQEKNIPPELHLIFYGQDTLTIYQMSLLSILSKNGNIDSNPGDFPLR